MKLIEAIEKKREQRYLRARTAALHIKNMLVSRYHVSRIVLIGSLLEKERFGFHSDIDLCVEGLQGETLFSALGEALLGAEEFDVDLIPLESISPRMKQNVDKGELLYVK